MTMPAPGPTRPMPRAGLEELPPYSLGESTVPGVNRIIALASNECATAPSPHAIEAYREAEARLRRYPDGGVPSLRRAIAAHHGLAPERIVCGNGSEQLIDLIARSYAGPGDEVVHAQYGYWLFRQASLIAGATPVAVPEPDMRVEVDAILATVTPRTRIVFLANPNNPTGESIAAAEIRRLHAGLRRDILLVLDAAYADYVTEPGYEPGLALAAHAENVVALFTFSKVHGLAALRVGWAYGPADVVSLLDRVRSSTNVSGPAEAAACAALQDTAHVAQVCRENAKERERFIAGARALGLAPRPSQGNFVLIAFPQGERQAALAHADLKLRGILLRPMNAYGLGHCLRATIGTPDEMNLVLEALQRFLRKPVTPAG